MRISSIGRASRLRQSGVTLIELLVVLTIASLIVGISFPSVTSGLDTLRLNGTANDIVGFMNTGLSRAERRQQVVEVTISRPENTLWMRSSDAGFTRKLVMPEGVTITKILPELPEETEAPRVFMLYPGGTVPPFGVVLINRRHVERLVQVDPMTGVAVMTRPPS
ncbi:MAG: pilus assembly FimT family protein [Bryobacteraceae bacterium]